jgi:hypothetical protein
MNAETLAKQWTREDVGRSVGDKCVASALLVAIEALELLAAEGISGGAIWADSIAREALAKIRGETK